VIALFFITICIASDKSRKEKVELLFKKKCLIARSDKKQCEQTLDISTLITHGPKDADTNDEPSDSSVECFFLYDIRNNTNDIIDFLLN